jgi:hypothetical protein
VDHSNMRSIKKLLPYIGIWNSIIQLGVTQGTNLFNNLRISVAPPW